MRIVSIGVVSLSLWCQTLSAGSASITPFTQGPQGGILVPVMVNGTGPHVFLVDTGAGYSTIAAELAGTVGAPAVARTTVSTPAGGRERLVVQIDRLGVGPITVAAAATVLPARELAIAGGVAGVLGQDVLAGLTYTIDYRRRHIAWNGTVPDSHDAIAVLPLAFPDGLPMVEVPLGDVTLRLVADSGTGGLVLFDGGGRLLPGVTPDGGAVRVDTFHGTSMARSARVDRFRVGASTFRSLAVVLLARANAPANYGDGLLPLHLFDRVTFDGPAGRLIVG